ncbi:hypothetical protein SAMN02927937_02645 [Paenimyroides aquimaris]|uniref:Uncharacterized protein n=2 Tax=Paenimyroides marinum TaxID=1159016 RepID=A0A1H6MEI3_9FLAO|nr:hypothetical protein SAMN02927937_02645 [Paenimyroides aquimaris]
MRGFKNFLQGLTDLVGMKTREMIKVKNKYNYPVLIIHFLWLVFILGFTFFKASVPDNSGAGYVSLVLLIFALLFAPLCLIILSMINKVYKIRYSTDFEFVTVPYVLFGIVFIGYLLLLT